MLIREEVLGKSPSSGKISSKPSQASSLAGHLLQLHHGLGDTSWTCGGRHCIFQISVSPTRLCPHTPLLLSPAPFLQHPTTQIELLTENSENSFTSLTLPLSRFSRSLSLSLRCNKTHFSLTEVFHPRKNKSAKFSHFSARSVTNFFYRRQLITFQFFPQHKKLTRTDHTFPCGKSRAPSTGISFYF